MFHVRRNLLIKASQYLKEKNKDYEDIEISLENTEHYPKDDILQ